MGMNSILVRSGAALTIAAVLLLPRLAAAQSAVSSINTIFNANTSQYDAQDRVDASIPNAGPLVAAPAAIAVDGATATGMGQFTLAPPPPGVGVGGNPGGLVFQGTSLSTVTPGTNITAQNDVSFNQTFIGQVPANMAGPMQFQFVVNANLLAQNPPAGLGNSESAYYGAYTQAVGYGFYVYDNATLVASGSLTGPTGPVINWAPAPVAFIAAAGDTITIETAGGFTTDVIGSNLTEFGADPSLYMASIDPPSAGFYLQSPTSGFYLTGLDGNPDLSADDIPEPTSASLLLFGAALLLRRRRFAGITGTTQQFG